MSGADADLIAAFKSGNAMAFEALYWRHADRVWRFARFYTGSEDASAEIVQEVFIRVSRALATFEGRAQFSTWLFVVVRSVAIEVSVKRRKAPPQTDDEVLQRTPGKSGEPVDAMLANETREAVQRAIQRLPENEREAVLLCELQELPIKEASAVLGWSESRVKVTLFRARRRLREYLASHVEAKLES